MQIAAELSLITGRDRLSRPINNAAEIIELEIGTKKLHDHNSSRSPESERERGTRRYGFVVYTRQAGPARSPHTNRTAENLNDRSVSTPLGPMVSGEFCGVGAIARMI